MSTIAEFVKPVFLIGLTVKSSLVLALTGLLCVLLHRSSAALRHWMWSIACFGVLLLPILSQTLPSWQELGISPTAFDTETALFEQKPIREPNPPANLNGQPLLQESSSELRAVASNNVVPPTNKSGPTWFSSVDWKAWIIMGWIAGVLLVLARTLIEISRISWIARKGETAGSRSWQQTIRKLKHQLRIKRPVSVVISSYNSVPLTFGFCRPTILLPQEARMWTARVRQTVLMHELAHVKRIDYVANLVAQLTCALHWYNPLAWIAAQQLHFECECATDDCVLRAGTENSDYANQLLAIARSLTPKSDFGGVIAMAKQSQISRRMQRILEQKIQRHPLTRFPAIFAILTIAAIVIPSAAFQRPAKQKADSGISHQELITNLESDRTAFRKQALGEIKDRNTLAPLISALDQEASAHAQEILARAIGELEDARAVAPLIELLNDPAPGVRVAALRALGEIGERSSFFIIIKMLNDANDKVRVATLSALRGIGCDPAFVAVTLSLRDSSAVVRHAAAKLLGDFNHKPTDKPANQILIDYKSSFPPVFQEVFGKFENLSTVDYLIRALSDPAAQVRMSAAETLGRMNNPAAVEALKISLQDSDPEVRAMAGWALDRINI